MALSLTTPMARVLIGCSPVWAGDLGYPRHWMDVVRDLDRIGFKTIRALERRGLVAVLDGRIRGFAGSFVSLTLLGFRVRGELERSTRSNEIWK